MSASKMQKQDQQVQTTDQKWEETLNSQEGLDLLDTMAQEALLDFDLGNFAPMNEVKKM